MAVYNPYYQTAMPGYNNYNNYNPNNIYQQTMQPQAQQSQQLPQNSAVILLISNEDEVRNYPLGPGQSMFFMDSTNNKLYAKSVDLSGLVSLRRFHFSEDSENQQTQNEFVTRDEFEKLKAQVYRRKTNDAVK